MKQLHMTLTWAVVGAGVLFLQQSTDAKDFMGPDMVEGSDAGSLPGSAKTASGFGSLNSINGNLSGPALSIFGGIVDFEDMYLIDITDVAIFSASTLVADGGVAGFDTQLWLFSADSATLGLGLLGNDNGADMVTGSALGPKSNDGTGISITNGLYYLAISGIGNAPQAPGTADIFSLMSATEISGPDGPGGMFPITGWTGEGGFGGYLITLEGVSFVPAPGVATVLVLGMCFSPRRRRLG